MKKYILKYFVLFSIIALQLNISAQIPNGYYDNATGTGATLKTNLYNIIKTHTDVGYGGLYDAYQTTDNLPSGKVWDMYSLRADGTADYFYSHTGADQCGSYNSEADCYNREHSFCDSWLGAASPQRSDLFHVVPTDGYVNNRRGSYPHGEVLTTSWTSTNGSKLGSSDPATGYTGIVFEPIDEFKGDFARQYFYVATCYENKIAGWVNNGSANQILDGTTFPSYKTWFINMLISWCELDPVSQKEIDRNEAIYLIQHNRNPYIDHPEYVCLVWGTNCSFRITSQPVITIPINNLYTYNITYTGTNVTLTCPTKPTWLTTFTDNQDGTAILQGTPTLADLGDNPVKLLLSDGTINAEQNFTITVTDPNFQITSTPVTSVLTNEQYTYNITYTGTGATLICTDKPAWITTFINNLNGTAILQGTPSANDFGTYNVNLQLSDGNTIINQSFAIEVIANNYVTIFNKIFNDNSLSSGGWFSPSILGNGQIWNIPTTQSGHNNSYCAYIYGFSSTPKENEDWLISPAFVPNDYIEKILTFWTACNGTGNDLKAYYSTNYAGAGDPNTATWTELSFTLPTTSDWTWASSGNIDISEITGSKAYIAFKYTSTTTAAKAWKIDDIKLQGTANTTNKIVENNKNIDLKIYPNPFNNYLNFEYYLTENSQVTIQMYDILGNKVADLTNEYQFVGYQYLTLNLNNKMKNNFVNGIYFINLKTENQNIYRKIILNK